MVLFGATDALIKLSDAGVGSICSLVKSINNVGDVSISAVVESIVTLVVAIGTNVELICATVGSIGVLIRARCSSGVVSAECGSIGTIVVYSRLLLYVVRRRYDR